MGTIEGTIEAIANALVNAQPGTTGGFVGNDQIRQWSMRAGVPCTPKAALGLAQSTVELFQILPPVAGTIDVRVWRRGDGHMDECVEWTVSAGHMAGDVLTHNGTTIHSRKERKHFAVAKVRDPEWMARWRAIPDGCFVNDKNELCSYGMARSIVNHGPFKY